VNVQQRMKKPHHRQLREVLVQRAPRRRHPRATVPHALAIRPPRPQLANQIRAVQSPLGSPTKRKSS
jgi:hypothetical protein